MARAEKNIRRVKAEGPCLKKGRWGAIQRGQRHEGKRTRRSVQQWKGYSEVKMLPRRSMRSSAMPQPRTTQVSGSSATVHRQAGFFGQQAVEVAQQRAAAGQHHAALGDVGAQLGRGLLQRVLDGRDDLVERLGQGFQDLVGRDGEAARHAFGQVAALDFHLLDFGAREGGADVLLDGFGGGLHRSACRSCGGCS